MALWCNKIKRRNGKDGFKVSNKTILCHKHFLPEHLKRAPGSSRVNKVKGAVPVLFPWNNWSFEASKRKIVIRNVATPSADVPLEDLGAKCQSLSPEKNPPGLEILHLNGKIDTLSLEKQQLLEENEILGKENMDLRQQLTNKDQLDPSDLLVKNIIENDSTCCHYTGFPTVKRMQTTFNYCNPGQNGENMLMSTSKTDKCKSGRPRALSPFKGYLLTLMKLRQNFSFEHVAFLFNIGVSTCSKTFLMWISYMYLRLGMINIWPSSETVKEAMPQSMKEKFPNTKVIIDCTEIFVECPSSLRHQKQLYSSYKGHVTLKILFGIMPGGGFTFISACFVGSISDRDICLKSGFLAEELWDTGDAVMADRGFTISDFLEPLGVELIIPSFLGGREQLSEAETIRSQQIAAERIHVERMIERFKNFRIFDSRIPISMFGKINEIVTICALLCNFQDPIIA